ncbi:BREX-2 system phosphatase PglZ [Rhodococcoides corynebacterioides]|uniref:BREX-2 system phosphatase PglZ n=1 Tax=Rhodococcoides corynebacterioides TaxID=53972 RepID=UPI0027E0F468|nr:BREX-2 system phosphatase PglZ [Rhodococcus corynebacterioides]
MTAMVASRAVVGAKLTAVAQKNYSRGVLGLHAAAEWDGASLQFEGEPVTVVACPSVLSVWEALHTHRADPWVVILTPLDEDQLGASALAHLINGRLMTPDPWDALMSNFGATTMEPALYRVDNDRGFALELLDTLMPDDYSPAPAGVLTVNHVFAAIAAGPMAIVGSRDVEIDSLALLEWSTNRAEAAPTTDDLRGSVRARFMTWLGSKAGRLEPVVLMLLESGRLPQLVPLGVVVGVFDQPEDQHARDLFLASRGLRGVDAELASLWASITTGFVRHQVTSTTRRSMLDEASNLARDPDASPRAERSVLLPVGLQSRRRELGERIDAALRAHAGTGTVSVTGLVGVEDAWTHHQQHLEARNDADVSVLSAAVRLVRWHATEARTERHLSDTSDAYLHDGAWVDTQLTIVRRGVVDSVLVGAVSRLIERTVERRRESDLRFARALADSPRPDVVTVESVLETWVLPLARRKPTLLLVVDALALPAAISLMATAEARGWTEVTAPGSPSRSYALAVLPTLTKMSRCSLLAGRLIEGGSDVERREFAQALIRNDFRPSVSAGPFIFHKVALDAIPAAAQIATDVANAISDTEHRPLVTAVLNYVDDTLHHADPGRTEWTMDSITHLAPLMEAASRAGRAVVITSDHGHVIDYGDGILLSRNSAYCHRAHADVASVDPEREVLVSGPRVMTADRTAVLAVDDKVRYQGRNAGYHGGGSPAEALVPVFILTQDASVLEPDSKPVGRTEPAWWEPTAMPSAPPAQAPASPGRVKKTPIADDAPSLFDSPEVETHTASRKSLGSRVISSPIFTSQSTLAGRLALQRDQFAALVDAIASSSAREVTVGQAATALGVSNQRARGALMQAKRVLDVEGYEVLIVGPDAVALDMDLLAEQFGVSL